MVRGLDQFRQWIVSVSAVLVFATNASAQTASKKAGDDAPAYKVNGKVFTVPELAKKEPSAFFEIEKKKFDLIFEAAREEFLNQFWKELSAKKKQSVDKVKEDYVKERVKVSDKDIKELLEKVKDHPQLSKLPLEERKKQVREYLSGRDAQRVFEEIIEAGIKQGKIEVLYPKPIEPSFDIKIAEHEPVRYGPKPTDTKPIACKGDNCPITVVEYSEFQCPFCSKMLGDTSKVLEEYKGKIRWYVRDFPLDFHPRARPAAVAAKCAAFQGKYWEMYYSIFADQHKLEDADFTKRAESLKLDMKKFAECYNMPKNPTAESAWKKADKQIQENFDSGRKYGVEGTPAFFINGRKLSGALPFAEFKRVIEEELAKKNPS